MITESSSGLKMYRLCNMVIGIQVPGVKHLRKCLFIFQSIRTKGRADRTIELLVMCQIVDRKGGQIGPTHE